MFRRPAKAPEAFQNARGHVRRRRIDHRVVVGKGNVAKKAAIVVAVKRAPAAIAILHAQEPLNPAPNRAFHALRIGMLHALERHQHERGVVHVGIKIVAEFERPAARLSVFVSDLPVARPKHLLRQHPVRSLHQRRMVRRQPRFFQRNHGNARVPNGRDARLHANRVALFNFKTGKFLDLAPRQRIVRPMPERHQRENRIHHRWVDGRESFRALDVIQQPRSRFAQRALTERLPGHFFVELQHAVERQKNVFPGNELLAPIECRCLARGILEQFIHACAFRQTPVRPQRAQDRHGNDDSARPRRHFVNVDVAPVRKEHQLNRNRRNQLPSHRADQRQIKPHVRIGVLQAAEKMHGFPSLRHVRGISGVACEL